MHIASVTRRSAIVLILLAIYLIPRLNGIDRMVTTDEADWLGGSANVYTGVAHGDLDATYQLPHPGLPTLWAGVVAYVIKAPDYPSLHPGSVPYHHVHVVLRQLGLDPLDMLITARIVKLLLQAALFLIAVLFVRRLFGNLVAGITVVLVSFEPFSIGNDRLLHIDGLVSIASFAAVLAIASAATSSSSKRGWAGAGCLCAIAWLTLYRGHVDRNRDVPIILTAHPALPEVWTHVPPSIFTVTAAARSARRAYHESIRQSKLVSRDSADLS